MKFAVTAKCPQCNRGCALYVFTGAETSMQSVKCNICTREMFQAGALPEPAWYDVWPFEALRKKVSDPLNVSVAEKGPAEQFEEPQIVHTPK